MLDAMVSHYTNGNKAKFATLLGVSAQTISAWMARNSFDTELIYTKCSYISADWLLSGEGSMLRNNQAQSTPPPVAQSASPTDESFIYKMYKEKDEENKALLKQVGSLEERLRQLEESQSTSQDKRQLDEIALAFPSDSLEGSTKSSLPMRKPITSSERSSAGKT